MMRKMDPLTQAAVGAAAAAAISRQGRTRLALVVGALSGAAPDIDVLIRSGSDPLLALEYHRHFTHSLLFVPVIALLVALLFRLIWKRATYLELAGYALAGTLTHGLIDACTSYGTMLYWPLSNHRESWDIISIIDPLFTLPLLLALGLACFLGGPGAARIGLLLCVGYLSLGLWQRERAEDYLYGLAETRGHEPVEVSVRPSFANLAVWRLIYRSGDEYHVDAVNLMPWRRPAFLQGASVEAFTPFKAQQLVDVDSVQFRDIERFRFFSQGFLYRYGDQGAVIGDLRYSMLPNSTRPLWGIVVDPIRPDRHVRMEYFRDTSSGALEQLLAMVFAPRSTAPEGQP